MRVWFAAAAAAAAGHSLNHGCHQLRRAMQRGPQLRAPTHVADQVQRALRYRRVYGRSKVLQAGGCAITALLLVLLQDLGVQAEVLGLDPQIQTPKPAGGPASRPGVQAAVLYARSSKMKCSWLDAQAPAGALRTLFAILSKNNSAPGFSLGGPPQPFTPHIPCSCPCSCIRMLPTICTAAATSGTG